MTSPNLKFKPLKENKLYNFQELKEILDIEDEKELKNTLNNLIASKFMRRIPKNLSTEQKEQFLLAEDFQDIEQKLNESSQYNFKFVGILLINNVFLYIYPKYISTEYIKSIKDPKDPKFKQIIKVVKKYNKTKEQRLGYDDQDDTDNYNPLAITTNLINSYYEYGLYNNENQIIEQNGEGTILWEKTINESTAYLFNKVPYYLDIFTINQENNEQDYFRRLHAFVLTEACSKFPDILELLDMECVLLSNEKLENFGSKEYIIQRINQELTQQFVTHKQYILKLIKKYLEKPTNTAVDGSISFIGSTSFNLVWEDVCKVEMGDCLHYSAKELGLESNKKVSATYKTKLKDIVPKPKWISEESLVEHQISYTLKPDIVVVKDSQLSIFDAKYYVIKVDEDGVKGQPGISDLTKQYLYELSYIPFAQEYGLTIEQNAFLLPSDEDEERKLGSLKLELFSSIEGLKNREIEVILKPCKTLYEKYLRTFN